MRKTLLLLVAICFMLPIVCLSADVPRNIILMVGDGMGPAQLTAGLITSGKLNIERMPVGGLMKTFAANKMVTDSAAGATALATGYKTNNGMVSVAPDKKPLKTLFEYAKENGKATGVAVTCSVAHATPAAFMAHAKNRNLYDAIAEQIANSDVDVLFGGGLGSFTPKGAENSSRKDKKDLLDKLRSNMIVAVSEEEFVELPEKGKVAALMAKTHPESADKRTVSLGDMTQKAINILDRTKKGFVLVVEGSQIDWAGHANDIERVESEMKEFDEAVGVVLNFAEKDKNTLVIVTADHETGGLALHEGSIADKELKEVEWTTKAHTAVMVPLFAKGPGAEAFGGIKDNTDIGRMLIELVRK